MKFLTNRKFNKMMKHLDGLEKQAKRFDAFSDPLTSRGSDEDRTQRLVGKTANFTNIKARSNYKASGFVQNIVDIPAEDATREWIKITTNLDNESEFDFVEAIENRLDELNIQNMLTDLIRYSRMYPMGAFLYYAVKSNKVQKEEELKNPIPEKFKTIEFINLIDEPGRVNLRNLNNTNPLLKNYNEIELSINGNVIHPSRLSWLVKSFLPSELSGISVVQTVNDAIIAQDNGLWSSATILNAMALNIFKSDEIADLSPEQKATLLAKIKHLMITFSAIALKSDEDFQQLTLTMTGMKDIFEFIMDNMAALARIPKNILLGKAHGVVTAGEYDTLNFYADVAKFQEIKLRPIIKKIIDMVVREENGEIFKKLNGNIEDLEVDFEFNTLWKLDPLSEADMNVKNSQRDQLDITMGKTSPEECRSLDERYMHLEPFVMDRQMLPDMTPPEIKPEDNPDNENPDEDLEKPEENKTEDDDVKKN